jgi:oxalate decarboxylase
MARQARRWPRSNSPRRGDTLEVVLALNNATYQSVSITAWMAANPDLLLATNFGVPESVFAKFPKGALIMPK